MTLEEAIERMRNIKEHSPMKSPSSEPLLALNVKAIQLGIEALKLNLLMRETLRWPSTMMLPGETYIPENIGKLPSDE